MPRQSIDLTGQRFGRLEVKEEVSFELDNRHRKIRKWKCLCDCGKIKIARHKTLCCGEVRSCGCLRSETMRKKMTKHGGAKSLEYHSWVGMIQRCYNPKSQKYPIYGGRGIRVHRFWKKSFKTFIDYIGKKPTIKHTLERINTDGNYCPGNVRWATNKEQSNNRRNNYRFNYKNKSVTLKQLSEIIGINYRTLLHRLCVLKWSVHKATTVPIGRWNQ